MVAEEAENAEQTTSEEENIDSDGADSTVEAEASQPNGDSEINPVEFAEGQDQKPEKPLTMDLLLDVNLPVRVELGRTTLSVSELLEVGPGSVVELDKMAGEPAELYIRDTFFARGEVVVVDNNFGLRITELSERAEEFGEQYG